MPGTLLDAGNISVNKADKKSHTCGACILVGRKERTEIRYVSDRTMMVGYGLQFEAG